MSRALRQLLAVSCTVFFCVAAAMAQDTPIKVSLKFSPQEGVMEDRPTFPDGFTDKTVAVRVVDGRKVKTAGTVGEGTGDEDRTFPILTDDSVTQYATDVLNRVVEQWGMETGSPADRTLTVKVTKFYVTESNKALGSMYSGDVALSYSVADRSGKTLASGTASGETKRYGRARSKDNYNEVLSDALKQAYANLFNEDSLQRAWASGKSSGGAKAVDTSSSSSGSSSKASSGSSAPCDDLTPEQRLKRLDDMLKKKMITKDEYDEKRAEIVKML